MTAETKGLVPVETKSFNETNTPLVTVPVLRGLGTVAPLLELLRGRGWIAGGYARWCCSSEECSGGPIVPPSDVDVFFGTEDDFDDVRNDLISRGAQETGDRAFCSELVVTRAFKGFGMPNVQLIRPFVKGERQWGPTQKDVIRQIDMTCCRISLIGDAPIAEESNPFDDTTNRKVVQSAALADPSFVSDESTKKIILRVINDPVSVTRHVLKYLGKGYKIDVHEMLQIYDTWAALGPEKREFIRKGGESDSY